MSTQGLKGEVRVQPYCDTPDFLLEFEYIYMLEKNGNYTAVDIEYSRVNKNVVIVKFDGIETVEQAQKLRERLIYINRDDIELEEGSYFIQDLIGLKVVDDADREHCYGELVEVSQTGANDVYHIKTPTGAIVLIPAIAKVVKSTDIAARLMTITPIVGLFDDNAEVIPGE